VGRSLFRKACTGIAGVFLPWRNLKFQIAVMKLAMWIGIYAVFRVKHESRQCVALRCDAMRRSDAAPSFLLFNVVKLGVNLVHGGFK
jgi:hypothetical protein